jgi:tRNA(Arg) A34 adenosine deaminase TadA
MNKHEKLLEEAKICSLLSPYHKYKIGAVLVLTNGKKYYGYNHGKSHPLQEKFSALKKRKKIAKIMNSFIHAEMHTIIQSLRKTRNKSSLEDAIIYIYRTPNNSKEFAMCRPCISCLSALKHYKVKEMYYTTDDSKFVYEKIHYGS